MYVFLDGVVSYRRMWWSGGLLWPALEGFSCSQECLLLTEGLERPTPTFPKWLFFLMAGSGRDSFSCPLVSITGPVWNPHIRLFCWLNFCFGWYSWARFYKNVRKAQPTTEKIFHCVSQFDWGEDNFDPAQCSANIFRIVRWMVAWCESILSTLFITISHSVSRLSRTKIFKYLVYNYTDV